MRVIELLQNDKKDSKWITDKFKEDLLFVDNSFQRRYVWLKKHQIQLIETILLGYAIPEIYLWATDVDPDKGDTKYSIVDGQQRIGALFDYIDGRFKMESTYLTNKEAKYANKYFAELDAEDKKSIWKYSFSIRQIPEVVSKDEIKKMFLRLNSTDKSLNPQELRNAEFDGEFLQTAQKISDFDFWDKNNVFTPNNIRRMGDIEFISSLLIFLRKGIITENQTVINEMYDLYNSNYDEREDDINTIQLILNEIQKLIDISDENKKFITKTTHLYTIFTLTYEKFLDRTEYSSDEIKNISEFIIQYNKNKENEKIKLYRDYSRDGTKNKKGRMERLRILKEYIYS